MKYLINTRTCRREPPNARHKVNLLLAKSVKLFLLEEIKENLPGWRRKKLQTHW
jgi:hypothetical protein